MKKIILFLICFLLLQITTTNAITIIYNETTDNYVCTGSFDIGYVFMNYSRTNYIFSEDYWSIKYGEPATTINTSLPQKCITDSKYVLRLVSLGTSVDGFNSSSYGDCWNGTDWDTITPMQESGGGGGGNIQLCSKIYDADYSTYAERHASNWLTGPSSGALYEDALFMLVTNGTISLNIYDEEAPTTPILSNLTITNGTTTLTYNNVSSQAVYMEDIRGTLTITANDYAGSYSQRQISATMESGQNKTENIYLLLDSAGFQIDLNVYDSLSTGITGALVNISRQSGYSYNYVTECTTDSAGYCFVTLNDTATYKFVVSKSGYVTKTQYITPTLTAYSFTLQTPTPSINFTSELGGVTMLLTPQITSLKTSDAQPFNFTITSNETLTSWGMQILWQNYTGTSLFTSTQSTATGGSVNATINTTLYNGTVVVRTFLQRDGYSLRSYYTNYTIHTITPYNHSLYNFIPDVQTNYGGTFSNLFIALAMLLFIVFAAALFGLGTEVSGALLFIGLGYLSYFGLIPFNLFLLAMILFMSYLLWKG